MPALRRESDAVIVATPDHTHAVASAAALHAGKPVFCEKPLTRTVHESRALRELARKQKVATSMGNQGTAAGPFRRALELIRNGALGEIKEVHVWNDSGGADRRQAPGAGGAAPEWLGWDLWLGPAANRPYNKEWMNRHLWREFGTSQLGNWASHSANLAFMALKVQNLWLDDPPSGNAPEATRVYGNSFGRNPEFYAFQRTLEVYREGSNKNSVLILTTDSDFYRYLKHAVPEVKQSPRSGTR